MLQNSALLEFFCHGTIYMRKGFVLPPPFQLLRPDPSHPISTPVHISGYVLFPMMLHFFLPITCCCFLTKPNPQSSLLEPPFHLQALVNNQSAGRPFSSGSHSWEEKHQPRDEGVAKVDTGRRKGERNEEEKREKQGVNPGG